MHGASTYYFARTVTIVLAMVGLSGIYNSWKRLGGSLSPLAHSAWGCMLLIKLSLALIALGHGVRVRLPPLSALVFLDER